MQKVKKDVKFTVWRKFGDGMQLEYTNTFIFGVEYSTNANCEVQSATNTLLKLKFISNFQLEYGIELHHNNISLVDEENKPSPPFEINEIYIEENDALRLFRIIRNMKLKQIINASYK